MAVYPCQEITEADIDKALLHLYTIRMKTGEFDPPSAVAYSSITPSVIQSQKHIDLALEIAEKTPVLLKNDRKILPLNGSNLKKIAIIGPKADVVELGPYSGQPSEENKITPLAGIQNYIKNVAITRLAEIDLYFAHITTWIKRIVVFGHSAK